MKLGKFRKSWRSRSVTRWLLALAFVAGQWAMLAHATEHELSADGAQSCETCSVAHSGGTAPIAIHYDNTEAPDALIPDFSRPADPALRTIHRTRSRAPPVSLS